MLIREKMKTYTILLALVSCVSLKAKCQDASNLKLKDFHPVSIYKIPETNIEIAKYPVIDFHSHDYPKSNMAVDEWVRTMDKVGIQKTIILSYSAGAGFDSVVDKYSRYKD